MKPPDRTADRLLARFGVSSSAEAVWHALLLQPTADMASVCRDSGVDTTGMENALRELCERGFVEPASTPVGFAPTDPSIAVGAQLSRAEREARQTLEDLSILRASISGLSEHYARGRVVSGDIPQLEVVTAIDEIRHRLEVASEDLESEHRCLMHSMSVEGIRVGMELDLRTLSRGIRQRSIIREADLGRPGIYALLETLRELGESTRVHPSIPTQLMIFDRKLAVVRVDPNDPRFGAMFIRVGNLIELLTCISA